MMYTHHYVIIPLVRSRHGCVLACVPSVALHVAAFTFNCALRRRSDVLKRDGALQLSPSFGVLASRHHKVRITELDPVATLEVYEISNWGRKLPP